MCEHVVIESADIKNDIDRIKRALAEGLALVRLTTSGSLSRGEAAAHFSQSLLRLSGSIDPPRTLIIAGGETLKALALAVGARALRVLGRLEPGLPRSVMQGGCWSGLDVISKSGAFGRADMWAKLLLQNRLI
jgi:uncharacterized protein YgbK (DUF1537 family)